MQRFWQEEIESVYKNGMAHTFLLYLNVGDILELKYYTTDSARPIEFLKTEIRHITRDETGRFKGLYLVGLSILEKNKSTDK